MLKKPWYSLKNEGISPEIFIYDAIDDWSSLSAKSVIDEIRDLNADEINVRINSPGGAVFEGIAIYNALRLHKARIHVSIEGLAASIASVIAMAGDTVTMAENAMMMIHNPYGWAQGDAEDMRKSADIMDKVADSIAVSYMERMGTSLEETKALMTDETWFTAQEALEAGLVDHVDPVMKAAAHFDLTAFKNVPTEFEKMESPNALIIANLCNTAGYPEMTETFLKDNLSELDVENRLASFATIKTLCIAAKRPDQAERFIDNGASVEFVRDDLFRQMIAEDQIIDNSLSVTRQVEARQTPAIDTQAIYRRRNNI